MSTCVLHLLQLMQLAGFSNANTRVIHTLTGLDNALCIIDPCPLSESDDYGISDMESFISHHSENVDCILFLFPSSTALINSEIDLLSSPLDLHSFRMIMPSSFCLKLEIG